MTDYTMCYMLERLKHTLDILEPFFSVHPFPPAPNLTLTDKNIDERKQAA